MDVPPPARPVAEAGADLQGTPPLRPPPGDDVSQRLASLEAAVADLARRVESLAASADERVSVAVAREVQGVSGELRHTVSELGRLLVRDLGKLSKILAEHRDAIVAEIRGGEPPAGEPPAGSGPDGAPPGGQQAEPAAPAPPAAPDSEAAPTAEPATPDDDGERSWLRRRRQS